jgi:hypothetical protein
VPFTFHLVSYTQRVVGNGIKAQYGNPEVKVKGTDPVTNQIIDKLKHVIQVSADSIFIGKLNCKQEVPSVVFYNFINNIK